MKAKKLPSGNWRVQAFIGTDPTTGRKIRKSFTARTKREAEYRAAEFLQTQNYRYISGTVEEALHSYLRNRENILSPTSIRGYKVYVNALKPLWPYKIENVTSQLVQGFINDYAAKHSPKTVRCCYSLLLSSVKVFNPNINLEVRLPAKKPLKYNVPTDNDIKRMLESSHGNLKKAIELAAFGTLRRGEVCALKWDDIAGNKIHVHSDMVKGLDNKWILKDMPKNATSDRYIVLPDFVIEDLKAKASEREITSTEFVITCNPQTIYVRFHNLMKELGMEYRFHDLRHYAASLMHSIGIPNQYIQKVGGWSNDAILNSVYRNTLLDKEKQFTDQTVNYLSDRFS
jgi:integrase